MNKVVATGRRMNVREGFIAERRRGVALRSIAARARSGPVRIIRSFAFASRTPAAGPALAWRRVPVGTLDDDLGAVAQPVRAVHHNPFARGKPGEHGHAFAFARAKCERAGAHRTVGIDHINKSALLAALDRRGG